MNKSTKLTGLFILCALLVTMSSCKKETSPTTGWNYNDAKNGGSRWLLLKNRLQVPALCSLKAVPS